MSLRSSSSFFRASSLFAFSVLLTAGCSGTNVEEAGGDVISTSASDDGLSGSSTSPSDGGDETAGSSSAEDSSGGSDGGPTSGDGDPSGGSQGDDSTSDGGDDGEPPVSGGGYYVDGNQIFDGNDQVHIFRGIDRPSLEWNPYGEGISQSDVQLMASWNANIVRVAINQGYWLPGSVAYNSDYPAQVAQVVEWIKEAGMDVILDLHWSDKGNLGNWPGQQRMADENSREFWSQVAAAYKDDERVLFELYNEPHDVSWQVWLEGGNSGDGFQVVGMQELYDTVRATGANNLVLVGGLDYAYDLSGVPAHRVTGYNIVYVSHPYDFNGKQPSDWEGDWGFMHQTDPLFVTEFGSFDCNPSYAQQLLDYAEARGLSWSAWGWYPGGCGFPALIEDWAGTPSAVGQVVKTALGAN